ncbi:ethanolamine ammonia-lyase subunit EutC [Salmonirosea aquatica]|uniref:Ethanolamine ammonia-lyase small subunit n=1 Tax=Salmonirosea aquatica TaxID=2654236 RepID=A0A7C9BT52_9BACT|nr:ethanolamine ammonia-lyase subunit EutC [Cytophagaceae bacterium SJW1-29]
MDTLKKAESYTVPGEASSDLTKYTPARVALGRTGHSLLTKRLLEFNLDHARARDAVYSTFDLDQAEILLRKLGLLSTRLHSRVSDRQEYLLRPDLGRQLSHESNLSLQNIDNEENELCVVVADGLSATAVNTHALEVIRRLVPMVRAKNWRLAPVALVKQGRVAIADEIAQTLRSEMTLILIGERPGLSSPDSLGAYLTYRPRVGLTDEGRNCVSNIRPGGLSYERAAEKIFYLLQEMKRQQLSGVGLKDLFSAGRPAARVDG